MRELKWAVVHFYVYEQQLECVVLREDFDSPKAAERWRSNYISQYPGVSPQELQVIQYVN